MVQTRHSVFSTLFPYQFGVCHAREFSFDQSDIDRFLSKCVAQPHPTDPTKMCLVFYGARSRGSGKNEWYGSFSVSAKPEHGVKKKTVRAHVFFAVAILRKHRGPGEQYDHECANSRCVSCIEVICGRRNASLSRGGRGRWDHKRKRSGGKSSIAA